MRAVEPWLSGLSVADQRFVKNARDKVIELLKSDLKVSIAAVIERMRLKNARVLHRRLGRVGLKFKTDIAIPACLDRAADLLRVGEKVKVAMSKVGYSDRSYFAKLFRERFGMLPSDYSDRVRHRR